MAARGGRGAILTSDSGAQFAGSAALDTRADVACVSLLSTAPRGGKAGACAVENSSARRGSEWGGRCVRSGAQLRGAGTRVGRSAPAQWTAALRGGDTSGLSA